MSERTPLIIYPYWKANPYVKLSLLAAPAAGFEIVPVTKLDRLLPILEQGPPGAVFHLHWTSNICQNAATEAEAAQQLDQFRVAVSAFKSRGGRLVWTVHNVQPHELIWPEPERSLAAFLAEASDRIHIMNPATTEAMREVIQLPRDRIRQVSHPSYLGVYVSTRSREQVRASMGFTDAHRVVALIGELRSYKGLGVLIEAMSLAASATSDPLALIVAGKMADGDTDVLEQALPTDLPVAFHPGYIDSEELADWFGAADLCVFPYQRILNSGSTHLAATMGVPVVLPGMPHLLQDLGSEPWVHFYDPARAVDSLSEMLANPATYEPHRARTRAFCRERAPWRISQLMVEQLYMPLMSSRRSASE